MNEKPATVPKPWIAVLLSFLCTGLGQMYCDRMRRGLTYFLLTLLLGAVAGLVVQGKPSLGLLYAIAGAVVAASVVYVVAIFDAWRIARRMASTQQAAHGPGVGLASLFVLVGFVTPIGAALWIRSESLEAFRIPTASMSPTLRPGDRILVDKLVLLHGGPGRGDVIVFLAPGQGGRHFVKRVVAVAGDRIEVHGEEVRVNGSPLPRTPAPGEGDDVSWESNGERRYRVKIATPPEGSDVPERVIAPGEVFVLGDQRGGSLDSRSFGAIRTDDVVGTVRYRFWPWSRFGLVE